VIYDHKKRPVYSQEGNFFKAYTYVEAEDRYECVGSEYTSIGELLVDFPGAVKGVQRRLEKSKKRHPDVHYRPAFRPIACWKYARARSTLTEETYGNAKLSSDVSKVTCGECLNVIEILVSKAKAAAGKSH
jgi:hypothetical protein